MARNDFGITIKGEKPMTEGEFKYDSRKPKMSVDLSVPMGHARLIDMNGGSDWSLTTPNQQMNEVIFEMEHHMPFIPQVLGYFLLRDAPSDRYVQAEVGTYEQSALMITFNNVAMGGESYFLDVDDKYVRVVHSAWGGISVSPSNPLRVGGSANKIRVRILVTQFEEIDPIRAGFN